MFGEDPKDEGEAGAWKCQKRFAQGPPFSPRDYMVSPSESSETTPTCRKKNVPTKLGISDIKIDSKYLLKSRQALEKMLEVIRNGYAVRFVDRLKDLTHKFLQGSPQGFLVEDIPLIVEAVEYFCRNLSSAPEFEDFAKTIMCFASEPPKLGKSSEVLKCKEILADYFTLFGEMLATFQDDSYQLKLLKTLYGLLSEQKVSDLASVKISCRFEAMEESQLPHTVASLMETIPCNLYGYYLELAVHRFLMSEKAGCAMIRRNALNTVLSRLDSYPEYRNPREKPFAPLDHGDQLYDYYRFLDNSSFMIWGLLSIVSRDSDIPSVGEKALWGLKNVLIREAMKNTKKGVGIRNNFAGLLFKLCALFGEKLPLFQTGLAVDMIKLSVATEIKVNEKDWVAKLEFGTEQECFELKKIMLLGCSLLTKNENLLESLVSGKVIEGILLLINGKSSVSWTPSQFSSLALIALLTLSELVPLLPENFVKNKGNQKLLSAVERLKEKNRDRDFLIEALRTLCIIITCENNKIIVQDFKAAGGINFLLDTAVSLVQTHAIKMIDQEKLSRIFVLLEKLLKNNEENQKMFAEPCGTVSLNFLDRIISNLSQDSKWSPIVLLSFGGFFWEAVAWCPPALKLFIEGGGVFLLLDFIEMSCFPLQMLFLGVLVDMTDGGETIAHLLTWRNKNGYGILNLLISIWKVEEDFTKVHRDKNGLIEEIESPLMTEEQWYLTHQVRDSHIYSPSIAEMVCSSRPKIHALYQFLRRRNASLTKFAESSYCIQFEKVEPAHQVYIPLLEHFLGMKIGEIWYEVLRDASFSGVIPTSFDGELMNRLLDERNKWASRIKTMQEEILLFQRRNDSGSEKNLFSFLKSCQMTSVLEAADEMDYVSRTSFLFFQMYRRQKRKREVDESLAGFPFLNDVNVHRLLLCDLNATHFKSDSVFIKSEKELPVSHEEIPLVSSGSCSIVNFNDSN